MIELVWEAHGRLPQRGKSEGNSIYAPQVNVNPQMDPGDVKAAMSLLKQERRRLEAEKTIELDPSAVEK